MNDSMMQTILKSDYEKYKPFLNKNRFTLDPDWEDYHQLNKAVQCGHKELAKLLILGGARVNKNLKSRSSYVCRTPLHLAVNLGCPEIVKMLLDKQACINFKNRNEDTPLMVAAKTRKYQILDLMLSVADQKNCLNQEKLSHLHVACMRNRVDVIRNLLQMGAQINNAVCEKSLYWPGFTALHFAVEFQCFETVELLLNCGADIVAKDAAGLTPLHHAHMLRDEPIIDLILSFHEYELSNPVDPQGLSHFHIACSRNNPLIVENFIKWGADIEAHVSNLPCYPYRPITFAINFECGEVVKLLLDHEAMLNLMSSSVNPMQDAYRVANQEIIDLILSRNNIDTSHQNNHSKKSIMGNSVEEKLLALYSNASLNDLRQDHSELTCLHLAVKNKCPNAIELMLQRDSSDAIIKLARLRNKTPLHLAFESQQTQVIDSILSTCKDLSKNPCDDDGLSLFHIACTRNSPKIVEKFLKSKEVDINAQVRPDSVLWPGYTALHFAVKYNALDVVKVLMKQGADATLRNGKDLTPLERAILSMDSSKTYMHGTNEQNLSLIDAMLSSAASSDTFLDDHGFTRLHVACACNDVPFIEKCLDLHPDMVNQSVNWPVCDWHGYTPLHIAAHFDNRAVVDLLLLRGANISAKNVDGDTPLHIAADSSRHSGHGLESCSGMFLLKDNPVSKEGESQFHTAIMVGDLEAIQYYLDLGVDVNERTKFIVSDEYTGQTPLHFACSDNDTNVDQVIKLLLARGAEMHARDAILNTPLHCQSNLSPEGVRVLLSCGAQVNSRNIYAETPLHIVCYDNYDLSDEEIESIIYLLLKYGADINAEDEGGTVPFEFRDNVPDDIYESVVAMFMRRIKQLQVIGYYVSEKNQREYNAMLGSCEEQGYYVEKIHANQCMDELARMAKVRIDSYTSLCDILHRDLNDVALHSKNKSFQKLVESPESLIGKFPIYGYLLWLQCDKGLERGPMLEQAKTALNWLIEKKSTMPVACLERILRSASKADLRNVIAAAKIP